MNQLNEEILNASKKSESSQEVFVPGKGWIKKTKDDILESYAGEFDAIEEAASTMRKKNEKAESKLAMLTGGYSKRAQMMGSEMVQSYSDLKNLMIEEAVYTNLQEQEEKGSVMRMDRLRGDIQRLHKDEMDLQGVYQELTAKTN
jgi:hypothetical protein